jgi:hypothetical protein
MWLSLVGTPTSTLVTARLSGEPFGYLFSPAGTPREDALRLVLVAETSRAMTSQDRAHQRQAIAALLATLPAAARLSLLSADFTVQTLAESLPPQQMAQVLDRLDDIVSAGALDLAQVLAQASEIAGAQKSEHILFFGRGLDGFRGDSTSAALARMQGERQTLVLVGGDERDTPLADVAALTGGLAIPWAQAIAAPARLLWGIAPPPATLELPSLERLYPLVTVTGETRWLARFVGESPDGAARAPARDLEALWARAHVLGTTDRDSDEGVRHRVLTPLTSLLVLETMADYARWGISAPASPPGETNATVGAKAVARSPRATRFASVFGQDGESGLGGLIGDTIGEAYGVGGFGIIGTGSGGAGFGRGGGLSLGRARAVDVVPDDATVHGSLDKEIIRRIIRRHLNEVRFCYESELTRQPNLAGRLVVMFTIGANGQVISSALQYSTMGNARVEGCLVQAVRRWEFPYPSGGGIVIVSYPFDFVAGSLDGRSIVWPQAPGPWPLALAELRKPGEAKTRIARVAQTLGAPAADSPAFLAWWLVEQRLRTGQAPPVAGLLIGELLREAGQMRDAVRLLSEMAPFAFDEVAAAYRRWGRTDEAHRVKRLKARS